MKPGAHLALLIFLVATSVFAQRQPLSLCIVQTKPDAAIQYEPSAGPFAMVMRDQLASQRLQNGTLLDVTVLPASVQKEILPEVQRLKCSWIVQLWYHVTSHRDEVMGDQDSLLFSLWKGDTREVIARGSGLLVRETEGDASRVPNPQVFSALARQILKKLSQLP